MPPPNPGPDDSVLRQAFTDASMLAALLEHIEEGVYMVDRQRRILYWNRGAERISGYLAHEVAGSPCGHGVLGHCDLDGNRLCGFNCPVEAVLAEGVPMERTVFLHHRQGHRVPVRVSASAIRDAGGTIIGAVEMFEQAIAPARIEAAGPEAHGCRDELTVAVGRGYGEMKLSHSLEAAERFGIPAGWMGIDLDGAGELEHRYGQGLIDTAMQTAARTIDDNLGSYDVLIRWERTGFRVLVYDTMPQRMSELARKLVALARASTLAWWGDPLRITVSIGAVRAGRGDSLQALESRIGKALKHCRDFHGDCAVFELEPDETEPDRYVRII